MIDLTPFCFVDNDEDLSTPELTSRSTAGSTRSPPIKTSWCGCRAVREETTTQALR
jgi:hypothetical protein